MSKLFICHTPLHIMIAEAILKQSDVDDVWLIYLPEKTSCQNEYYFNRFKENCKAAFQVPIKRGAGKDIFNIIFAVNKLIGAGLPKEANVYAGNIKSIYSRIALLPIRIKSLNTFDDGFGSISGKGYFYETKDLWVKEVFFAIFKKSLRYINLVRLIDEHYTIYDQPGVYRTLAKRTTKINLLVRDIHNLIAHHDEETRILLTCPLSERGIVSELEEVALYNAVILNEGITTRLRHPGENIQKDHLLKCNTSECIYIAEEVIVSAAKDRSVVVFGFLSSALLHISGNPNILPICLFVEIPSIDFSAVEPFQKMDIQIKRIAS